MKLKCFEHQRRVVSLPTKTIVHRNDGTVCSTKAVVMGTDIIQRSKLMEWIDVHSVSDISSLPETLREF